MHKTGQVIALGEWEVVVFIQHTHTHTLEEEYFGHVRVGQCGN